MTQDGAAHPVGTDAVLLGAWADVYGTKHFLDIGTGTGVVALMLAQRLAERSSIHPLPWKGVAVEMHPDSAALAKGNFAASAWARQLDVWQGPIQAFSRVFALQTPEEHSGSSLQIKPPFDLIVSNPPFFSELTISPDKTRSLGRHTATLSPEDLLACAAQLLAPAGKFCVILPEFEGRRFCELAVLHGLYWTRITEVCSRPGRPVERLLLQFEKSPYAFQRDEICIYAGKTGVDYADAFKALTRDFYLAG